MTKNDWKAAYFMSPQSVGTRARLRELAAMVAEQTGRDFNEVLKVLVCIVISQKDQDRKSPSPAAIEFEMNLHDHEFMEEQVQKALLILRS